MKNDKFEIPEDHREEDSENELLVESSLDQVYQELLAQLQETGSTEVKELDLTYIFFHVFEDLSLGHPNETDTNDRKDLNLILKRVMKTLDLRGSDVSILLKQMMGKICVAQAKKIIMDLERFGAFEGNLNELH